MRDKVTSTRIVGLALALVIIAMSLVGIGIVSKIVAIGGPAYRWEYLPEASILAAGAGLTIYWLRMLLAKKWKV